MASYLIKRNDSEKSVTVMKVEKTGYDFKPNFTYDNISIKKITIYNPQMIDVILTKKIDKSFKKIAAIVFDILNSDDSTAADGVMALDEVAKLRGIILNKYQKYLDKEKEEKYLKRLRLLENELRAKITYERNNEKMYEEIMSKLIGFNPKKINEENYGKGTKGGR